MDGKLAQESGKSSGRNVDHKLQINRVNKFCSRRFSGSFVDLSPQNNIDGLYRGLQAIEQPLPVFSRWSIFGHFGAAKIGY